MGPIRVWACLVATGILIIFAGMALATHSVDARIATPAYDGSAAAARLLTCAAGLSRTSMARLWPRARPTLRRARA